MNKKKWRKFINNPRKFFMDSYFVKRLKRERSMINYQKQKNISSQKKELNVIGKNAMSPRESFDFNVFSNMIYKKTKCFTIKKTNERSSICILADDIYSFYENLASLSVKDNLIIAYNLDGKLTRPVSYNQLLDHLCEKRQVEFKISDRRSKDSIYFLLEIWKKIDNYILAPRANMLSRRVFQNVIDDLFADNSNVPDLSGIYDKPIEDCVDFDIDYVYTWVNSEDIEWQKMYAEYKPDYSADGNSLSRFTNREELKYSLRSLEENAPWVRKIFVVSNCKAPAWLNLSHSKIHWVFHDEIFEQSDLPTFSSHAIETRLHKIPGLSEHFIYSNDDFFIARSTSKRDFFLSNGLAKIRFEPWGNVNGDLVNGDPDYLNAARNCQKLLERDFNKTTTQLHTHSPQSMNKKVLEEMELVYANEFTNTAKNKFRDITDIAVTGYLYHHYAYLKGMAIKDYTPTRLIQQNHDFSSIYNKLLIEKKKVNGNLPLSFCVNDGADSHLNNKWNDESISFLNVFFPNKSQFEK